MLHIHCPGTPLSTKPKTFIDGLDEVKRLGLDGEEIQFGKGIFLKEDKFQDTKEKIQNLGLQTTIHGPFYVNLNAKERPKYHASISYITKAAKVGAAIGAKSVCFHPAYRFDNTSAELIKKVREALTEIEDYIKTEGLDIHVRPESGGKKSQFGTLEELIAVCQGFEHIKPCVDFAHHMAVSGGVLNNYDAFCEMLEQIKTGLGPQALKETHIHAGSVAFTDKGETHALMLDDPESQFKYKELIAALVEFEVEGWVTVETPDVERSALMFKREYEDRLANKLSAASVSLRGT